MGALGRRVDALEAIAAEARRRELRGIVARLPAERGVSAEAAWAHVERLRDETIRMRAEGLTDDQIVAIKAARLGFDPHELRRRAEALAERLR